MRWYQKPQNDLWIYSERTHSGLENSPILYRIRKRGALEKSRMRLQYISTSGQNIITADSELSCIHRGGTFVPMGYSMYQCRS